ncbi:NAD(P)-binding protein [Athelia psychrophila]|uniref:NAD(P)-binding protein n=1 Tax=Athelia psychrophila TaxID=1759441 RepID=A0A166UKV3_9AGAM|nr:NAD(P)-binding protein [Fibularhizoctonia sp. CBS 109695]
MKIAITGGNGRLGENVVREAVAQGHCVVGIDQVTKPELIPLGTDFSFIEANLTVYDQVIDALRGCEAVIHLAATPHPRDYGVNTHNNNVVTSWNVLRAAAELDIKRIAQASSVNVITMVYSLKPKFDYFPLDEDHPCLPDEPYGLSKVICELQADTIVRRFPGLRIASIRPPWCVPSVTEAKKMLGSFEDDMARKSDELWGYVRYDCVADAFLRAVSQDSDAAWSGHEAFFAVAPDTLANGDSESLRQKYWSNVPVKGGGSFSGKQGFFDCSKAERLLGWVHPPDGSAAVPV